MNINTGYVTKSNEIARSTADKVSTQITKTTGNLTHKAQVAENVYHDTMAGVGVLLGILGFVGKIMNAIFPPAPGQKQSPIAGFIDEGTKVLGSAIGSAVS